MFLSDIIPVQYEIWVLANEIFNNKKAATDYGGNWKHEG